MLSVERGKRPVQRLSVETMERSAKGSFSSLRSFKVKTLGRPKPSSDNNNTRTVEIGCVTQEGLYHENEDRMEYGINLNSQIDGFVGVFDGHGGEDCADFVASQLSSYLRVHFNSVDDWKTGEDVMQKMFHCIEEDFTEVAVEEEDTSGSCATVVVVKGSDAIIANIGDCKAVAVPNPKDSLKSFKVLTGDHRADHPEESKRINLAGGSVVDGRVCNLQPSRSFGDIDVKEVVGDGVVIPTPEVSRVRIQKGGFMIVATDGLWDSVETEEAVKVAKRVLDETNNDAEVAADTLVDLALEGSSFDDITVSIIVWNK